MFFEIKIYPNKPETREEINMIIFALLIINWLSKANNVINIDIVNPIPPKIPILKSVFQFTSSGNRQSLKFTANFENRNIPNGFPKINPKIIPML